MFTLCHPAALFDANAVSFEKLSGNCGLYGYQKGTRREEVVRTACSEDLK